MEIINPVQGIEGATVVFKGFPPHCSAKPTDIAWTLEGIPFRGGARGPHTPLLLRDKPAPAEGTGTKLDIIA